MGILASVLTVFFFILCLLLIVIILLQSDKSAGMGILGGSSQTTFGSSTADVITKTTAVMVGLFMFGSLGLSVIEAYRSREFDPDAAKIQQQPSRVAPPAAQTGQQGQQQGATPAESTAVPEKDVPVTEKNVMKDRAGEPASERR
jgi:preprotein translocase subunit SecG